MTSEPNSDKAHGVAGRIPAATWLGIAAIAVALLAAAAAAFSWYLVAVTGRLEVGEQRAVVDRVSGDFDELRQAQRDVDERIRSLDSRLDDINGSLRSSIQALESQTSQSLEQEAQASRRRAEDFRREFDALSESVGRMYEALGRSVDTWMLEEVEQLLLLANQRLSLVEDAGLAITALSLADQKLEEIGDPALIPVRGRIADELAALDAVPKIDVSGAALRLDAMLDRVAVMPLSQDLEGPEWQFGESPDDTAPGDEGGMKEFVRGVLDDLGELVRIKRVDETRLPRLKPVQRFLVHENLRLRLSGAQYALLKGYATLFGENLTAAREWTARYYDVADASVQKFLADLDELAALPVTRDLPSIDGSLELLRETMSERLPK